VPLYDEATRAALERERRLARWAGRGDAGERRLHVRAREAVEPADLRDYGGFGDGWSFPDEAGVWTQGSRSELALALDGIGDGDCILALSLGSVCVGLDASLEVAVLVNGERAATRDFHFGDPEWRIELPSPASVDGEVDLMFEIEDPTTPLALGWSADDDRRLGINLRTVTFEEVDRSVRPGERIAFTEGSGAERLLGEGWSALEPTGVWTDGERACLVLRLTDVPPGDAELVLEVDAFVTPDHPELEVEVSSLDEQLGGRLFRHSSRLVRRGRAVFRPGSADHALRVPLPASVRDDAGRVVLELRLRDPASPLELGLSRDARRLGLHLRSLVVREPPDEV
jgi:hypothetical protein